MKARQQKQLDFSGAPNSWFDLWHTHVAWNPDGAKDWGKRKEFLSELFDLYNQYKSELTNYPADFQLWILVDDNDSGYDAVYIHTKNPNSDNFPIKVPAQKSIRRENKELSEFLSASGFDILRYDTGDGVIYYLSRCDTGIKLEL